MQDVRLEIAGLDECFNENTNNLIVPYVYI